jgi:Myb-like DNA-binding domain
LSPQFREGAKARGSWDANDMSTKKELSRQSSLSSIASTQVSEQPPRDTRPASKPPDAPAAPPDLPRSTSGALGENSSGPSSTCSSPRQLPLPGPQAALASRFKTLNTPGPASSPLSSVVTAEKEVEAPKASAHDASSTNGNHTIVPNSNSMTSPAALVPSSTETPVNPPSIEKAPATQIVNGATRATAQSDVSSPVPAHLSQSNLEDPIRKVDAPAPSEVNPAQSTYLGPGSHIRHCHSYIENPAAVSVVEGTLMEVDEVNKPPPSPRTKPSQERQTPSDGASEPVIADQAPVFKGFAAFPFSQSTFAFGSRPGPGPDDLLDEEPEMDTLFDEELPPREPVILLQLKPLFPPNAPVTDAKPSVAEPASLQEALRAVVMTRMVYDKQTRDDIVNPVLLSNRALIEALPQEPATKSSPHQLIAEVHRSLDEKIDYPTVRESLATHFEERQNLINDKANRLSEEYLRLHKKWKAHCEVLDAQQRINNNEAEQLLHGRTTRRTAAFTDTVRSDLEMEQVIASLGVDDLTDPSYLSSRNSAVIPDMIAVTEGEVDYLFDDTNHLIEDPEEYYGPHTGIDDWTEEEKRIFIDKFAMYPKQFGLIADHIPHKTAAQCVDYYYLHKKKIIDFRKVVSQLAPNKRKKRGGGKKKGNALLTDIAQHDATVGKDHLSTFVVPSRVAKGKRKGRAAAVKAQSSTPATANTPQPDVAPLEGLRASRSQAVEGTPLATPTPEPEGRPKRSSRKSGVGTTQPSATSTPVPEPPPAAPLALAPVLVPALPTVVPEPKPLKTVEIPMATPSPLSVEPVSWPC